MSDDDTAKIVRLNADNEWQEHTIHHVTSINSAHLSPDSTKTLTASNRLIKIVTLGPTNDHLYCPLFIHLLEKAKRAHQTVNITADSWKKDVWDRYNENEKALLRRLYPNMFI